MNRRRIAALALPLLISILAGCLDVGDAEPVDESVTGEAVQAVDSSSNTPTPNMPNDDTVTRETGILNCPLNTGTPCRRGSQPGGS